ncbi:MAG TPA: STAS domain-containing protein [Pseudonocardiaceae bacterium]|nr:STAS domain-containing protein [Pseudonocardiaceae bacterium]
MSGFDNANPAAPDPVSSMANGTTDRATVTVTHRSDAIVVTAIGEIDLSTAPQLEDTVRQCLTQRPAVLVIDLAGVQFFSSAGLAVLVLAHREDAKVALRVVASNRIVLRALELTGLADDLDIHPSLESALSGSRA